MRCIQPVAALVCVVAAVSFAPSAAAAVAVAVTPSSAALEPNASQQFTATVTGSSDHAVTWLVNGVRGGSPAAGVISAEGLYTAPIDAAEPLTVTVTAIAAAQATASGRASVGVAAGSGVVSAYYVAKNGNDANPGTAALPWRTIQHAVDFVPVGGTIFVRNGTYNELVTITRSGSAVAGFMSLEAAPGDTPVIDGTGLGVPNGQNGLVTIQDASFIRVAGFEIQNYVSKSAANVPIGIYVVGAGNHIEILSNHIRQITTTVTTSSGDALGIAIYGSEAPAAISQLTIDGNELDHLITGYSESLSLSGNVTLWQVTRNLIHNNDNIGINIEGYFGTAPDIDYDQARNGLVAGNTVYAITSIKNPAYQDSYGADGIYVDGGTYVTIQDNLVYDTDLGIEMASEMPGRATTEVLAHDNVVYHSYVTGISIGGADPKLNGGTQSCVIDNNTLFDNDTTQSGSGEFQIQFNAKENTFYNNILYANSQGLLVNGFAHGKTPPATLDHNLYYSSAGDSGSQWLWLGATYTGFADYQSGTHLDAHGSFANPVFADLGKFDFQLGATSPAIDLGENLGVADLGLDDFAGAARLAGATVDAGAYEH
jgi:hypothetical protein